MSKAEKKQRHKWEKEGHSLHHRKHCINCGCIKDEKVMGVTQYELNGQTYFNAPPCEHLEKQTKIIMDQTNPNRPIKAEDLCIGLSYVTTDKFPNDISTVVGIDLFNAGKVKLIEESIVYAHESSVGDLLPITLTPGRMEHLGFMHMDTKSEYGSGVYRFNGTSDCIIELWDEDFTLRVSEYSTRSYNELHLLQNLVLSLTGQKLIIKDIKTFLAL
jgi:hypothetical protein